MIRHAMIFLPDLEHVGLDLRGELKGIEQAIDREKKSLAVLEKARSELVGAIHSLAGFILAAGGNNIWEDPPR